MSHSQHPVALSIERRVGGATKLLATVMCLPLLDGIFPALVLEVGLLIFSGSATVAVILAEMDGTVRQQATAVLGVGTVLVIGAVLEAAIAPTIAGLIDLAVFERFAGLVILAVAAHTASARIGDILPRPAIIIAFGLVASIDPAGARLVVDIDPDLLLRAAAAALVAVAFALHLALLGPWLRKVVDIDRFRFGSAVALGVLPLSLFGLVPGNAPLALIVLGLSFLFAFDPDGGALDDLSDRLGSDDGTSGSEAAMLANGGESESADDGDEDYKSKGPASSETVAEEDRAPWL